MHIKFLDNLLNIKYQIKISYIKPLDEINFYQHKSIDTVDTKEEALDNKIESVL